MSEHAWATNFMGDISLVLRITADICETDLKAAAEASRLLKAGLPIPPEHVAKKVWMDRGRKGPAKFPPIFYANSYWVVSSAVADILRRFDLGNGTLSPVSVVRSDKETPVGGEWYCWIFGNQKDTLDAEASVNLQAHRGAPNGPWRKLANHPADNDAALNREALIGPDVWVEKRLKQTVLLSGALGDALIGASLGKALRMTRVRIGN